MSAFFVSLFVFGCVVLGAILGTTLARVLPEHHLTDEARDSIKISVALVATLSALVLGLLTASAKSGFDAKKEELRTIATDIIRLDRTLSLFGPATAEIRSDLKNTLTARIAEMWPEEGGKVEVGRLEEGLWAHGILRKILDLTPQTDAERWLQSHALALADDISVRRWTFVAHISNTVEWSFVAVISFWLAVVFGSFALFAPKKNASVAVVMLVAGLSVAGAFYLILEMDQPYDGLIKISSAPLRNALSQLGRV